MNSFRLDETYFSRFPALQVLASLGQQYPTSAEAWGGGWRPLLAQGGDEYA